MGLEEAMGALFMLHDPMVTCIERVHFSQVSMKLEALVFLLLALCGTIPLRMIPPGEAGAGLRGLPLRSGRLTGAPSRLDRPPHPTRVWLYLVPIVRKMALRTDTQTC